MKTTVDVLLFKGSTAKLTVPNGTRPEIEKAIADKLRSDKALVWTDSDSGINVTCLRGDDPPWKPRRRFFVNKDEAAE
jgi:hypothetical protein